MSKKAGRRTREPKDVAKAAAPRDVTSPRAKSSGHRKKTADKWNQ